MSAKAPDQQSSHAYHIKIAMRRLWNINIALRDCYLKRGISWASMIWMPDVIMLGKTVKGHMDEITEAMGSGINSEVVEDLNDKINTVFRRPMGSRRINTETLSYVWRRGKMKLDKECKEIPKTEPLIQRVYRKDGCISIQTVIYEVGGLSNDVCRRGMYHEKKL